MYQRIGFILILLIGIAAAQTISIKGKVTNKNGAAIPNANVTLIKQKLQATTGSDGTYSISGSVGTAVEPIVPVMQSMALDNGILELNLSSPSTVKIDIFNVQGNLLRKEVLNNASSGVYHLNIAGITRTSNVLIVHTTIGDRVTTFRYLPLNKGKYILSEMSECISGNKLTKAASIMDSLKVTATGFTTKSVAISSYNLEQNISLDSSTTLNNVGASAGCGKPLSSLKSGTYTISGSGREYILDIPTNYDPNHPYRLIFGIHWFYGSDKDVSTGQTIPPKTGKWSYYGLKALADNSAIFVAPNGTGNPRGWGAGEADLTFFDDMVKLFKGQLCIDTNRIFSIGFSFGSAMSFKLANCRPNVFRAVVCQDGGYMSGDCATNKKAVAYMGVHGVSDGTCNISGGRTMRDRFVTNNGCQSASNLPDVTKGSRTHNAYKYTGCKDGYPVWWYTFDGDHRAAPYDGPLINNNEDNESTWIPAEAWKFFSQF